MTAACRSDASRGGHDGRAGLHPALFAFGHRKGRGEARPMEGTPCRASRNGQLPIKPGPCKTDRAEQLRSGNDGGAISSAALHRSPNGLHTMFDVPAIAAAMLTFLAENGGQATWHEIFAEMRRLGLVPDDHTPEREGLDPDEVIRLRQAPTDQRPRPSRSPRHR